MLYVLFGIIAVIASIFLLKQFNQSNIIKTQTLGIYYVTELKSLITLIQQHRGLNAAWLNGDKTIESKIYLLHKNIKNIIDLLNKHEISKNERWVSFEDHWRRVLSLKNTITVPNSFEQHCLLIQNLAYLLEDMADSSYLTSDYVKHLPNIGFTWRELITSTESIGQSRAIGTSVSTKKLCTSVDKIRLNFLTERMDEITKNTLRKLSYLPKESVKHHQLINEATQKMSVFIATISQELIHTDSITIDHQKYFELATETIAAFSNIFDHQVEQIKTSI